MRNEKGFHTYIAFPSGRRQRLTFLLFLIVWTTLFLFGHDLFWYENIVLFKYFFALYISAIVSYALCGYSLLRFGLAFFTGGPLGAGIGYVIGHLVNHYYPVADGPGMAPNFTDVFRLFLGIIIGLSAGLLIMPLILNWLRGMRQNTRPA
jgi:hypothetical protein